MRPAGKPPLASRAAPASVLVRVTTAARVTRPPSYWTRLLPVLLALSVLTRLPSFTRPLWNPDEGYLATQARMLADGGTLYDTVVDRKPPLLPLLYRACFAVFGDGSLWPLKAAAVLAVAATAALVAALARRRWGDRAGWTAGVLYVLVSIGLNPEDAQAANFEVFLLPFTAAAVWCADRRWWGRAGLAVAGAALVKQTGAAVLLPVLVALWRAEPRGDRRRPLGLLALGGALPVAVAAVVFGPARFLFWTVTGSGSYASLTGSELHVLGRGLVNTAILAVACAGLLGPLLGVVADPRRRSQAAWPVLWAWLAASVLATVTGLHFFGHYFLQLLPPLVLLGTGALTLLPRRRLRRAVVCTVLGCALFLGWGVVADRSDLDHARAVAAAARQHAGPREPVLVWGMHPECYWLADRRPASRYLTAGLLTNYSGGRAGGQVGPRHGVPGSWRVFLREMREQPPRVVVDDSRGKPYRPARVPALRSLLATHYQRVAVVEGAVVYVRTADRR